MRKERQISHAEDFQINYVGTLPQRTGSITLYSLNVGSTVTFFQRGQYGMGRKVTWQILPQPGDQGQYHQL